MIRKIWATVIKEWLLLKRDIAGFLLLFLMPALLIVIMALVQDAPFRDYQDMKFDLLLADEDGGSLAKEIKNGLQSSGNFRVIDAIEGQELTAARLKQLLDKGRYQVGIVIPQGTTAEAVNASNHVANAIAEKMGAGKLPVREARDSVYIRIFFDPVAKPAFRTAIGFALDKFITRSSGNMLLQRLAKLSGTPDAATTDTVQAANFRRIFQGISLKEEPIHEWGIKNAHINSVQHNVPAWAIFGMFFIVIPIAGNMIKEREEGSAMRIAIIPGAYTYVALGKILFYTLVCVAQFMVMVAIGLWVLPMLGLPALYLGQYPLLLLLVVFFIAYAATAFGYFSGVVFLTNNQAMPFGAISIVILSAIGGIWVPVELLPGIMQKVAYISPLYWGLQGVQQLVLRDAGFTGIALPLLVLFLFGSALWLVSVVINNGNRYKRY